MLKERVGSWRAETHTSGDHADPSAGVRIRRAVPDDVAALNRLVGRSVLGLQARDYDGQVLESALRNRLLTLDLVLISDGTYHVAEAGDRIVGAGGWSRRRKIVNDASGDAGGDDPLDPATEAAKIRAF